MKLYRYLLIISFLTFFGPEVFAQSGNLKGEILDSLNHPVANASVSLQGTHWGTYSNDKGNFILKNVQAGDYTLVVSIIGYQNVSSPVSVKENETNAVTIRLREVIKETEVVSITATGIKEKIRDVPSTINVIDQKQIQESGAQSVGQIISRVPGVNYLDEDGRGLKPNIGLRGLDPVRNRNLLVLIDGKFPIGMTLYGDPASYYMIPLQQVERIEVIKGASPVLYGGYSVGGVINMITKSGKYAPERNLGISYGSWNSLNVQFSAGADNGKFGYYVSGLRRQGDGYRARSEFGVNDYTVKLVNRPDSTSELSVYLNAFSEKSQTSGGITQKQFEEDPTQSNHRNDEFIGQRYSAALTYKKRLGDYHHFSASAYGNYFQRDWWIAYKRLDTINAFLRDIHSIGTVLDYNYNKNIFGLKNSFIAGVRIHTDRLDDVNVGGDTAITRVARTTGNRTNNSFIYEGFLYDELSVTPNFTVAPGIRYTSVRYRRDDYNPKKGSRNDEMNAEAVIYSLGAIYKVFNTSRVYGTFSRGYNPPSLNSALDPANTLDKGVDLKAETSYNTEIGVRINPWNWLSLNAAWYNMNFSNKVVTQGGITQNAGRSHHRGVETELELGPWKGLRFFANTAIQKATFVNGVDNGKLLPYAPRFLASFGVRYQLFLDGSSSLTFNVYGNHVGKQYNDSKNTEAASADGTNGAIPAYTVLNATVNYNRKHWGLFFNAYNFLDQKYITMRWAANSWNGIIPGQTANFMTGVNFKF